MTPVMITTMVVCFALTISVAVSIGLASVLGIQASNANMLISVKEMFNAINKFPLAAIPRPPCNAAPRSVMMSPNMLLVTMTSNWRGSRTICMHSASTYMCEG